MAPPENDRDEDGAEDDADRAAAAKREKARQKKQRQKANRAQRRKAEEEAEYAVNYQQSTSRPSVGSAQLQMRPAQVSAPSTSSSAPTQPQQQNRQQQQQMNPLGNKRLGTRAHLHVLLSEVGSAPWLLPPAVS